MLLSAVPGALGEESIEEHVHEHEHVEETIAAISEDSVEEIDETITESEKTDTDRH